MKRYGFTLIELLIVVAIIVVLVAMLMPTFATARQQSYKTVCASNLRQVAKATLLYAQDHDECFPLGVYVVRSGETRLMRTVWGLLKPYAKSDAIYLCPADTHPTQLSGFTSEPSVGMAPAPGEPEQVSLMPNWCLLVNSWVYPEVPPVSLARLPFPAGTGFWYDGVLVSDDGRRFEPVGLVDPRHARNAHVPERVWAGTESQWTGRIQAVYVDTHIQSHPNRLRPDAFRRGDITHLNSRPRTVDGRTVPMWYVVGGVYDGKASLFGWPSRPNASNPNRTLLQCYPRPNYCEEWD
ncbi:MAG: prepilin-type N-terminal cleavage/methylation domain-containing protein [Fimbriimonadales bacterium]